MAGEILIGDREYFPSVERIPFEGPESDNPLAFRFYDEGKLVAGTPLRDHMRFSVAYWHSFCGRGEDPFGTGTRPLPWQESTDPMWAARDRLDAAFEFITKLGAPFYCFHDRDLAPEGRSIADSEARLEEMASLAGEKQTASGVRLLWGTANLFSHPRYMNGAATNPDFRVLTHAAAQVKTAIDATIALGGENYVFWGGREGYFTLLNTEMSRELDHLAEFLRRARDYGRERGFEGAFLIEPKPMEPTKHQYDFDVSTVIAFLHRYDLAGDFKINIENNHATLAGHTFAHEMEVAASAGLLGSLRRGGDLPRALAARRARNGRPQLRRESPAELHRPGRPVHRPHRLHGHPGPRLHDRRPDSAGVGLPGDEEGAVRDLQFR
jgi:xylose isomerase